jgi:small-conductance mechanosensitive channel
VQHGDHEIKSLGEEFRAGVTAIKQTVEAEEKRLAELRDDQEELAVLKSKIIETEDDIIMEIEDKAEKCIEHILKNKEDLKKQANVYFRVTKELNELPGLITKLERTINDSNQLLEQAELHPRYVEKLNNIRQTFDELKQPDYVTRMESYRNKFTLLQGANIMFCPLIPNLNFGYVRNAGPTVLCQSCGYGGSFLCMNKTHTCPECTTRWACTCKPSAKRK